VAEAVVAVVGDGGGCACLAVMDHDVAVIAAAGGELHPGDGAPADGREGAAHFGGGVEHRRCARGGVEGQDLPAAHVGEDAPEDDRGATDVGERVAMSFLGDGGVGPGREIVVPDLTPKVVGIGVGDPSEREQGASKTEPTISDSGSDRP